MAPGLLHTPGSKHRVHHGRLAHTARVEVVLRVAPDLRPLLPARHRPGEARLTSDGTATVGHLVESAGVPLTEVGELRIGAVVVDPSRIAGAGDVIDVLPVTWPQPVPRERFVLDVHLGALARRMRLLGIDTAYRTQAEDPELVAQAVAEERLLLTRDRGLLRRRALPAGALVRADRPDDQLVEVVRRFAPAIAPFTRCPACNVLLVPAAPGEVADRLEPGTRRTYAEFSRCPGCGRVYWRGAHAPRLDALLARIAALRPGSGLV
jgi:uncharacterized protein with PIN domain